MSVTEGDSFFLSLHLSFVGFQLHDFGTSWGKQERTMCHWVIVLKSSQYHSSSFWIQDGNCSLVHTVAFQQTHTRKALAGVPFLLSVFLAALEDSAEILPCLCKVGLWTLVSPSHSAAFSVLYQQCGLVILYKRQSSRQVIEGRDGWMDGWKSRKSGICCGLLGSIGWLRIYSVCGKHVSAQEVSLEGIKEQRKSGFLSS